MIIAWGSRGDLQPVTSLARQFKKSGRDVLVFGTPPATNLVQANGINCVVAKENVEVFVENMFGRADLSDRSISGLIRLAKFAKVYLNSADYVATHIAVAIEEVTTDQAIVAPARAISVQVQS